MIHNSSVIDKKAEISKNVKIGPFCYVGPYVKLKENVELISNVHIEGNTTIGKGTRIFPFASIGTQPQDLKFRGENNSLVVGENNLIREYVTINPGTEGGGSKTVHRKCVESRTKIGGREGSTESEGVITDCERGRTEGTKELSSYLAG